VTTDSEPKIADDLQRECEALRARVAELEDEARAKALEHFDGATKDRNRIAELDARVLGDDVAVESFRIRGTRVHAHGPGMHGGPRDAWRIYSPTSADGQSARIETAASLDGALAIARKRGAEDAPVYAAYMASWGQTAESYCAPRTELEGQPAARPEPCESKKVNRATYERLVEEDLAWLMAQPRTLEREHIALIVRQSVEQEYPVGPVRVELDADVVERLRAVFQRARDESATGSPSADEHAGIHAILSALAETGEEAWPSALDIAAAWNDYTTSDEARPHACAARVVDLFRARLSPVMTAQRAEIDRLRSGAWLPSEFEIARRCSGFAVNSSAAAAMLDVVRERLGTAAPTGLSEAQVQEMLSQDATPSAPRPVAGLVAQVGEVIADELRSEDLLLSVDESRRAAIAVLELLGKAGEDIVERAETWAVAANDEQHTTWLRGHYDGRAALARELAPVLVARRWGNDRQIASHGEMLHVYTVATGERARRDGMKAVRDLVLASLSNVLATAERKA
jgi:hypothetical protein